MHARSAVFTFRRSLWDAIDETGADVRVAASAIVVAGVVIAVSRFEWGTLLPGLLCLPASFVVVWLWKMWRAIREPGRNGHWTYSNYEADANGFLLGLRYLGPAAPGVSSKRFVCKVAGPKPERTSWLSTTTNLGSVRFPDNFADAQHPNPGVYIAEWFEERPRRGRRGETWLRPLLRYPVTVAKTVTKSQEADAA